MVGLCWCDCSYQLSYQSLLVLIPSVWVQPAPIRLLWWSSGVCVCSVAGSPGSSVWAGRCSGQQQQLRRCLLRGVQVCSTGEPTAGQALWATQWVAQLLGCPCLGRATPSRVGATPVLTVRTAVVVAVSSPSRATPVKFSPQNTWSQHTCCWPSAAVQPPSNPEVVSGVLLSRCPCCRRRLCRLCQSVYGCVWGGAVGSRGALQPKLSCCLQCRSAQLLAASTVAPVTGILGP